MSGSHYHFLVAVHAFFIKDNQVLLLERANTGYMDGSYSVPAGHVDGGESIWQAMQREILEETGLQISDQLFPSHVMHRMLDQEERIDYFFVIKDWSGTPQNTEPNKCKELSWFLLTQLPENTIPYVQHALEQVQQQNIFSEFIEPTT